MPVEGALAAGAAEAALADVELAVGAELAPDDVGAWPVEGALAAGPEADDDVEDGDVDAAGEVALLAVDEEVAVLPGEFPLLDVEVEDAVVELEAPVVAFPLADADEVDTPVGDFPPPEVDEEDDPPVDGEDGELAEGPLPHPKAKTGEGETSAPIKIARITLVRKRFRITLVRNIDRTPQRAHAPDAASQWTTRCLGRQVALRHILQRNAKRDRLFQF